MRATIPRPAPYAGLRVYSEEDASFFFGRRRTRDLIISNLRSSRLTLVFGPSGVGKSSVLEAGVAHELKRLAQQNVDQTGAPCFAVTVFNKWQDDPVAGLISAVEQSAMPLLAGRRIDPPKPSSSLADNLGAWAECVGGDLLIILDQFEDHFLDQEDEERSSSFDAEFARAVNQPGLRVNFILSIRDDAYSRLDHLKPRIPNLYANSMRIEHLDAEAARAAIEKPIRQYNRFYAGGDDKISIEPELTDEVLRTVRTGRLSLGDVGRGESRGASTPGSRRTSIEAPFLQLVMTELWKAEMLAESNTLRLGTLERLGGADQIVSTHLARVMEGLSEGERDLAAGAFGFLVTSSGHKIPYTASDLAVSTELDRHQLLPLLEKLARGGQRILRASAPIDPGGESRYEIAHDVIAKAAFAWRTHYREQQRLEEQKREASAEKQRAMERARGEERERFIGRLRRLAIALAVALVVAVAATVVAIKYYREAERGRRNAVVSGNIHSEILAGLYGVTFLAADPQQLSPSMQEVLNGLESDDKQKLLDEIAAANIRQTLDQLNDLRDEYQHHIDSSNQTGAGIVLNNIAGVYKFVAEIYSGLEDREQAQAHYMQAQEYYKQAEQVLKCALGPDHPDVATSVNELGQIDMNLGGFAGAETRFRLALAIMKNALGADDRYVSDAEMNLAECLYAEGKYEEAEPLYSHAAAIRIRTLGDGHREVAASLVGLAGIALDRANYADAERRFNEALDAWKNSRNPQEADAVAIYHGLAAIHRERGEYREAERYLDKSGSALKDLIQQNHLLAADDLENLGLLRMSQGNTKAKELFEWVLGIRKRGLGKQHPDTARSASNVALVYYQNGDYANAETCFNEALEVQKELVDSPDLAITLFGLGRLYVNRGGYSEAEVFFKQALAIQTKAIPDARGTADTLAAYAALLQKTGRQDEASSMEKRSRQIRSGLEK